MRMQNSVEEYKEERDAAGFANMAEASFEPALPQQADHLDAIWR